MLYQSVAIRLVRQKTQFCIGNAVHLVRPAIHAIRSTVIYLCIYFLLLSVRLSILYIGSATHPVRPIVYAIRSIVVQ